MAAFTNPALQSHSPQSSIEHDIGYDAYNDNVNLPIVDSDDRVSHSTLMESDNINIYIIFVFVLELLVLIFVSVLEYFLRVTEVFPLRFVPFDCADPDLSYTEDAGEDSFRDFTYNANVSHIIIVTLCFCVPPVMIIACELPVWQFSDEPKKMVRALCHQCKLPQVLRRMVRYIGTFLFGILLTMIFVDVTKLFIGRLRPNFLDICQPDAAKCLVGNVNDNSVCKQDDSWQIRQARMSFPSFHAAVSAYAATFMAVYLHHIIRASCVRILRPFLALGFMVLALMCSLARYGLYLSHWTDVAAGFTLGLVFALYMCVFVLHNFFETLSSKRLYQKLREFMFEHRALELRELYKEERLPGSYGYSGGVYAGGIILPRPHVHANGTNESTTDEVDMSLGEMERVYQPSYSATTTATASRSNPPSASSLSHLRKHVPVSQSSPVPSQSTYQRGISRTPERY